MIIDKLTVNAKSHKYPILVTCSPDYGKHIYSRLHGKQILVVTNDVVAPLYLAQFIDSLKEHCISCEVESCILPDGEQYKNQNSINTIYDVLLKNNFSRDCTLIALGGGVIGDLTGFAAASYMRGVNFIQVPTTLLAQVDSSVGGKTGINHTLGKNMIGAFWQPELVLADMDVLKSLPKREFASGLAEVIKYALIMDLDFLSWLEDNLENILGLEHKALSYIVKRCCELKAQIVAEDERESGKRALLNFGHTFGHAIENYQGYGSWLHGEAVAAGMVQAAKMSCKQGWISECDVNRIITILQKCELPVTPPKMPVAETLALMVNDKKSISGKIRLVLLQSVGSAIITKNFSHESLVEVLEESC